MFLILNCLLINGCHTSQVRDIHRASSFEGDDQPNTNVQDSYINVANPGGTTAGGQEAWPGHRGESASAVVFQVRIITGERNTHKHTEHTSENVFKGVCNWLSLGTWCNAGTAFWPHVTYSRHIPPNPRDASGHGTVFGSYEVHMACMACGCISVYDLWVGGILFTPLFSVALLSMDPIRARMYYRHHTAWGRWFNHKWTPGLCSLTIKTLQYPVVADTARKNKIDPFHMSPKIAKVTYALPLFCVP